MRYARGEARNSRFQTRTAYMLALDIDYRSQCVAHAHQVRDLHSMVGRGARARTFRVRVRVRVRYTRAGARCSIFLSLVFVQRSYCLLFVHRT